MALSSCEAEYMALKEAIKESIYIQAVINELAQLPSIADIIRHAKNIYTDSQLAIALAKNPIIHLRFKHIDLQYHFVREKYNEKRVNLLYILTSNNITDSLTKAVNYETFIKLITGSNLAN